uniref:CABIT domain-containing protein n=1 Tax=Podarcis muralis TaxID=64176 RepID=A0A670JHQ9_PODMU
MDSVSFHQYICDLDLCSLPRVVKICSGVYFQGSVYEVSGNECCLSTGDLMKIIDVQLQNISCKNVENGHIYELPLDFKAAASSRLGRLGGGKSVIWFAFARRGACVHICQNVYSGNIPS